MTQQPETDWPDWLAALKRECYQVSQHQNFSETTIDCVIDHLARRGMLNCGWLPIESVPRDEFIDTFGYFVEKGSEEKCPMRHADDYIFANKVYPIITTHFEREDGAVGSYYRTHWMPLPAAPFSLRIG